MQKTVQIGHQCRFDSDSGVGSNRTVMSEMIRTLYGRNRHLSLI